MRSILPLSVKAANCCASSECAKCVYPGYGGRYSTRRTPALRGLLTPMLDLGYRVTGIRIGDGSKRKPFTSLAEDSPDALQSAQISSPPEYCSMLARLNISSILNSYFKQNTPTQNIYAHAQSTTCGSY